ncbi:MAG TPA: ubiquinol-cytochrome c reductase iron-sulfur subunit [Gaiellaceae bacterium]|jgi:ubiquinol-cytochrome c reductase iron-sulfur subunit|nr:ubiquinol-cytochrome c reductase iron-sulfur subunit [Gaiellaceae bacterium]
MNRSRAELGVIGLLLLVGLCTSGFVVVYAVQRIPDATQYLGLSLGLAFVLLAAACLLIARRLVSDEELEDEYAPVEHEADQEEIVETVTAAGERFTRKRLVVASATVAGAGLGAALIAPIVSFGPVFDLESFVSTPWRRGVRLVGDDGQPLKLDEIDENDFYTAYPEGADREQLAAPIVVVRLPVSQIHLPEGRDGWAPHGVLAYSKICTHAGCAVSLYRKPTFAAVEPGPALVCPCHYSTFDPARGGAVLYGPAGRPLPQLPLEVGTDGDLRGAGTFSGPVGPSWWGVRSRRPT